MLRCILRAQSSRSSSETRASTGPERPVHNALIPLALLVPREDYAWRMQNNVLMLSASLWIG